VVLHSSGLWKIPRRIHPVTALTSQRHDHRIDSYTNLMDATRHIRRIEYFISR